jgi:cholesterol transport system auxiliary component
MKVMPVFALLLALAACGPIVQIGGNEKPPQALLTLNATATPRPYAGPGALGPTIAVDVPRVPMTLQTVRLPVTTSATDVSFLVGATWAEQPNRQFQQLLVDTLSADGQSVINRRETVVQPARVISGTLRTFGLDVSNPGAAVVRVRYDAQLTANGAVVSLRRFDAVQPVTSQSPSAVAAALNLAANAVAAEVSDWVKQQP